MNEKTVEEICVAMRALGLNFYRQYHVFGESPAFKNVEENAFYWLVLVNDYGADRCSLELMNPAELLAHLKRCWRPVSRDDVRLTAEYYDWLEKARPCKHLDLALVRAGEPDQALMFQD